MNDEKTQANVEMPNRGKKLDMGKFQELLRTSKDDKEFRRRLKAGEADADE